MEATSDVNGLTETERDERKTLVNSNFNGCPSLEAKTLAEELEELEAEIRKLEKEIDNQTVIDLNLCPRSGKSKEKKLPRKLRKGW